MPDNRPFHNPTCCRRHRVQGQNSLPCSHFVTEAEWKQIRSLAANVPPSIATPWSYQFGLIEDLKQMERRALIARVESRSMHRWRECEAFRKECQDFIDDIQSGTPS